MVRTYQTCLVALRFLDTKQLVLKPIQEAIEFHLEELREATLALGNRRSISSALVIPSLVEQPLFARHRQQPGFDPQGAAY
jgi:hypothetical protein